MHRHKIIETCWITPLLWLLAVCFGYAHDPGLSSADVTIAPGGIIVSVVLNARDWDGTGITTPENIRTECFTLALDGRQLTPESSTGPTPDHIQNVGGEIVFPNPGPGALTVSSLLFDRLPFGHREFVKINDTHGHVLAEEMLRQGNESCEVRLLADSRVQPAPAVSNTFLSFLLLGVRHILTGYDHMLFLAGLLLVCTGFRQAAGVITWFTVAHSITLALAAFNILAVPSRIVEPAVAASIAYVGIENILRPGNVRWRGPIAFSFGLVHGLGFASILRTMGIGSGHTGIAIPLISFNLGVELGQLSVALTVLPIIFILREQPRFVRLGAPSISLIVASLGGWWFLQRTILS